MDKFDSGDNLLNNLLWHREVFHNVCIWKLICLSTKFDAVTSLHVIVKLRGLEPDIGDQKSLLNEGMASRLDHRTVDTFITICGRDLGI